jgi:hypothetical protein
MQCICSPQSVSYESPSVLLVVDGVQTILHVQPESIRHHEPFMNLLWFVSETCVVDKHICRQELCPRLVALLGTPTCTTSTSLRQLVESGIGRGQDGVANVQGGDDPDVSRSVYTCVIHVVND